jgi:hypothetical protein
MDTYSRYQVEKVCMLIVDWQSQCGRVWNEAHTRRSPYLDGNGHFVACVGDIFGRLPLWCFRSGSFIGLNRRGSLALLRIEIRSRGHGGHDNDGDDRDERDDFA